MIQKGACVDQSSKRLQQGSAMLSVMAISAIVLILITLYAKRHELVEKMNRGREFTLARNELAKTILSHISNPEFIRSSAARSLLGPGNQMLKNCLSFEPEDQIDCLPIPVDLQKVEAGKGGYYKMGSTSRSLELYRLVLISPDADINTGKDRWLYQYPGDRKQQKDKAGNLINCPSGQQDHISCVLAGAPQDKSFRYKKNNRVGYNFRGESGELGPCYPLEPVVYMNPVCGADESGQRRPACTFAEDIGFAVQIIHRDKTYFDGEACEIAEQRPPHSMGSYPGNPDFIYQPRHLLAGYECNFGAFAKGYTADGNLLCECRFPYQTNGKRNEKGTMCEKIENKCPDGTMFSGRNKDGSPVCRFLHELSEGIETNTIVMGTKTARGTTPGDAIECEDKGWLQDLNMTCSGTATAEKKPVKESLCWDQWAIFGLTSGNARFFTHNQFIYVDKPLEEGCTNLQVRMSFVTYWEGIRKAFSAELPEERVTYTMCLISRFAECLALAAASLLGGPAVLAACLGTPVIPWVDVSYDCYPISREPAISCSLQGTCYKFDSQFIDDFR